MRGAGDLPRVSSRETFLTFDGDGGVGGTLGDCASGGAFGSKDFTGFGGGGGISLKFNFGSAVLPDKSRFKLSICLTYGKVLAEYLGGRGCDVDA